MKAEPAVEDPYADGPLPDGPQFADPEPEFEPAFTYDGPLPEQPAGREDEWTPPVFALHYDKQPEPDQGEQAQVGEDRAQVERGDYGTADRLDTVPEAEATYPAPVVPEVDEHQTTLFAIDAEVPARVAVGAVRDETTLRDEELRATLWGRRWGGCGCAKCRRPTPNPRSCRRTSRCWAGRGSAVGGSARPKWTRWPSRSASG
ncbi:hypothetical protein AB0425_04215 [Actinosynnema sp. NPDC051121]